MNRYSFAVLSILSAVAVLVFANGVLLGQGSTNPIGGPANPTAQTGWFSQIPYHFGVEHLDKADFAQYEAAHMAKMKVVDATKLKTKGFSTIKVGDLVQVIRVSDKQAKIKLLPNGPEKTVDIPQK
jgi:hypothetical protein